MDKKKQIIKLYEQKMLVHPAYSVIAKKVKVSKTFVYLTIKDYKKSKEIEELKQKNAQRNQVEKSARK